MPIAYDEDRDTVELDRNAAGRPRTRCGRRSDSPPLDPDALLRHVRCIHRTYGLLAPDRQLAGTGSDSYPDRGVRQVKDAISREILAGLDALKIRVDRWPPTTSWFIRAEPRGRSDRRRRKNDDSPEHFGTFPGRPRDRSGMVRGRKAACASGQVPRTALNEVPRRICLVRDGDNKDNFTAYKLPIADVIDGELTRCPRAVMSAAGVVDSARGGSRAYPTTRWVASGHLARYYKRWETPPWKDD